MIVNAPFADRDWAQQHHIVDDCFILLRHCIDRSLARGLTGTVPAMVFIWSVLRWERKAALMLIESFVDAIIDVENRVDQALYLFKRRCPRNNVVDFSEVLCLVEMAHHEASFLTHKHVGPEHVLLAYAAKYELESKSLIGADFNHVELKELIVRIQGDSSLFNSDDRGAFRITRK